MTGTTGIGGITGTRVQTTDGQTTIGNGEQKTDCLNSLWNSSMCCVNIILFSLISLKWVHVAY